MSSLNSRNIADINREAMSLVQNLVQNLDQNLDQRNRELEIKINELKSIVESGIFSFCSECLCKYNRDKLVKCKGCKDLLCRHCIRHTIRTEYKDKKSGFVISGDLYFCKNHEIYFKYEK